MSANLNLTYVDYCYLILVSLGKVNNIDSIYESYILELVGTQGLNALKEARYLETCGTISGRQLYTLTGAGIIYMTHNIGGVN